MAAAAEGLHDKACELFEAAKKSGYEAATCVAAAARSLRAAGKHGEARSRLDSLPPADARESADLLAERAALLAETGGAEADVVAALERALEVDPGHPTALFHMAMLHDRHGNDQEAIECYERAVNRYPSNVGSLPNLGLLYEDRDEFAKAQKCYRRILEAFPYHPRARLFLKDSSASSDLKQD